jgi:carbamoylphosphate synthase large subunit
MKNNSPTLVMIGGGIQEREAIKLVQSSGFRVLTTDINPDSPCFNSSDFSYNCDGRDVSKIADYIKKNKKDLNIQGIFTLTEMVESVAAIGVSCDLPSVSLESAKLCQSKEDSKNVWLSEGIPTPIGKCVKSIDEARKILEEQSHDCFVKPVTGFGGVGASRISSDKQLDDYYTKYQPDSLIIEEYLGGEMLDLNGCFDEKGNFVLLGCFERSFGEDVIIESSAIHPSQMPDRIIDQAKEITAKAAKALHINWGPVKSDLIVTPSGIKVLEIAPRLHGPKGTIFLTSISQGTNHLSAILPVLIGSNFDFSEIKEPKYLSSFQLIQPPDKPFSSIDFSHITADLQHVMIFKETSNDILKYTGSSDAIGYFFTRSTLMDDLVRKNKEIGKKIIFND